MTPPNPSRRRLTEAEWDAELARAKAVQASDVDLWCGRHWHLSREQSSGCRHGCDHSRPSEPDPLVTRTDRRRSWWQRGWKR